MNRANTFLSVFVALAGALAVQPASAQTNLLGDPSFEQHPITANSSVQDPTGTGWTFSGQAGLINGVVTGTGSFTTLGAPDGSQFTYLRTNRSSPTANNDGTISQTVTFPASGNYALSVKAALRDSHSASFNTTWTTYYMLEVDGVIVGGNQHGTSNVAFNTVTQTFYATAGAHAVALVSGGPTSGDTMTFIDNVQLTAASTGSLSLVNVTSVPQSLATGVTSEPITLTLTDTHCLQVNAPAGGKTLSLTSSSSGGQFLDASNNVISSVNVPAGSNTATVYYRDSVAGAPTLTVSGSGLTAATQTQSVVAAAAVKLAHQSGYNIVDGSNNILHLYGVNLGCWLTMEGYLCPLDTGVPGSGTVVSDQYTAVALLDSRFGVATEQSLFRTYQSTWITDADLQNVKNAGMNVVRVPFWWGNLYTTNFEWRSDAFEYLDWVVSEAAKYNIYVILDLHGSFGSQTFNIYSGTANLNRYWENSFYQSKTAELWTRVATHFRYNNNVLAYDLLNEPDGAPGSGSAKNTNILNAQKQLYQTVRAVDGGHMIIQELTGGSWDWNQLPSPASLGWTNVAYSPHSYPPYGSTAAQAASEYNKQTNEFAQYSSGTASGNKQENVPDIIGEMNWEGMEQSWLSALGNFNRAGINWLFWSLKGTEGTGQDRWALYNNNGFAWGDPEGQDAAGNYPNGSIADLYRPNLMQDSAQDIANEWGAFTTAGTASTPALPGTYPLTVAYPANFHENFVLGDPLTDVLLPQTAIAESLLPPIAPPANGVAGVNFGFENPFVSHDIGGGDAADFRTDYLYDPQAVSAGWTFTGQAGITSTGLQTGGITGWNTNGTEVLAPQGKQVAFIQGTSSGTNGFTQTLTSAQAGAWTVTFSAAEQNGSGQSVAVSLNGTALGTIKPGSTYADFSVVSTASLAAGAHPLAFTATATGGGILIDNVRVTVGTPAAQAPVVNSGGTVTAYTGYSFAYTISATNRPTSYRAAGLPAGLSVNTSTGLLSGKPTATGTFAVTLGAANATGSGTQGLTLVVVAPAPYLGYSASGTSTEGNSYSYRIGASGGTPTSYNAYGLPAGLTVNPTTGYITGTPTVSGTFSVLLAASNATGTAEEVLTLTINPTRPVITSPTTATATQGKAFSYVITANYQPTSFNATGLPTGLSVNTATGVVSGTPTSAGTFNVSLSAGNASGAGTGTLSLTVNNPPPPTPAVPTGLVSFGWDGQVDLRWTASANATGYNVARSTSQTGSYTIVGNNIATPHFSDTGVTDGTTYYYEVSAVGVSGTSAPSAAVSALPQGYGDNAWTSGDIGAASTSGSADYGSSSYTLTSAGVDIWGAADAFQFMSQPLLGDGTVVARVASVSNSSPYAKAGVMIRAGLASNAANMAALVSPGTAQGVTAQWRLTAGASSAQTLFTGVTAPYWVKLVRAGSTFTAYRSVDGVSWTAQSTQTISMTGPVYAGLAVTAHNNSGTVCTATFDSVSIVPGPEWSAADLGAPAIDGFTAYSDAALTLNAAGADFWGTSDQGRYVYQPVSGDCDITVRMTGVENSNPSSKAGVMIRETLAANSDYVDLLTTANTGVYMQSRPSVGASTSDVATNGALTPPCWLRLTRVGNTFTASTSPDGSAWTTLGSTSVTMGANVYIGVAATSHDASKLGTATIENITVNP